jgi:hypothetical protein
MRYVCCSIAVVGLAWWCGMPGGLAEEPADGGKKPSPAYVQSGVIKPATGRGSILGLCVSSRGGLVAVTGSKTSYGAGPQRDAAAKAPGHRVVWLEANGTEARAIELDFAATCIASGPDGGVYAAGDGAVVLLSADGKEIARGETPQAVKTEEERAELLRSTVEKREAMLVSYENQIERTQDAVDELVRREGELEAAADDSIAPRITEDESADEDGAADERTVEELKAAVRAEQRRQIQLATTRRQIDLVKSRLPEMRARLKSVRNQDPRSVPPGMRSSSWSQSLVATGMPLGGWTFDFRIQSRCCRNSVDAVARWTCRWSVIVSRSQPTRAIA